MNETVGMTGDAPLGPLERSPYFSRLRGLPLQRRLDDGHTVEHPIGAELRTVAQPVTFTPFASVRPCTARCRFCSEALVHDDTVRLSATLRPGPTYAARLRDVLSELRGLPMGLSLSGLEATDDAPWLLDVLDAAEDHLRAGGTFDDRVLYPNGTGLSRETTQAALVPRLMELGVRLEISRHHPDQARNDAIMRFRRGVAVADQRAFEATLGEVAAVLPVKLVCILQKGGVDSPAEVRATLAWARSLGVSDVVFRELSRLGDDYRDNATRRYIDDARVRLEPLLEGLFAGDTKVAPFAFERVTAGYYFWNLRCRHEDMTVTFETSDYRDMKGHHKHDSVVRKLVLHANGNLCADWDPLTRVLSTSSEDAIVPLVRRRGRAA